VPLIVIPKHPKVTAGVNVDQPHGLRFFFSPFCLFSFWCISVFALNDTCLEITTVFACLDAALPRDHSPNTRSVNAFANSRSGSISSRTALKSAQRGYNLAKSVAVGKYFPQ